MHYGCKVLTYESGIIQPFELSGVILVSAVAATVKAEWPRQASPGQTRTGAASTRLCNAKNCVIKLQLRKK